jgi:hypothetical protein
VFDLLGREVAVLENGFVEPGIHRITFDASRLGSGVYYYRIKTPEFQQIRKLLFLR